MLCLAQEFPKLFIYHSSNQPVAASNSATCPEPVPAPASVAITTMSSAKPMPSDVGESICDPMGMRAFRMALDTSSPI